MKRVRLPFVLFMGLLLNITPRNMDKKSVLDLFDLVPFWLYEVLPGIYLVAGLLTAALLDHALAWMSSALLVGSGLYVLWMRWRARHRRTRPRGDPEVALLGMTWMRNYASGQPVMDAEHRELFDLSHEILGKMMSGAGLEVDELLEELCESVERHFRNEDDLLYQSGVSGLRSHRRSHHRMVSVLHSLRARQARGQIPRGTVIKYVLTEMIRNHMVAEDIALLEDSARTTPGDAKRR